MKEHILHKYIDLVQSNHKCNFAVQVYYGETNFDLYNKEIDSGQYTFMGYKYQGLIVKSASRRSI